MVFAPRRSACCWPSGVPCSGPGCRADHPDRERGPQGDRARGVHPHVGPGTRSVGHYAGGNRQVPGHRTRDPADRAPRTDAGIGHREVSARRGKLQRHHRHPRGGHGSPTGGQDAWRKARSPAVSFPADPTWCCSMTRSTRCTRPSRTWRLRLASASRPSSRVPVGGWCSRPSATPRPATRRVTLTGDLAGTLVTDAEGRLHSLELPAQNRVVMRAKKLPPGNSRSNASNLLPCRNLKPVRRGRRIGPRSRPQRKGHRNESLARSPCRRVSRARAPERPGHYDGSQGGFPPPAPPPRSPSPSRKPLTRLGEQPGVPADAERCGARAVGRQERLRRLSSDRQRCWRLGLRRLGPVGYRRRL